MPIAIRTKGIAILHKPMMAYQLQFLLKASILIPLTLHSISRGILANITLTNASVMGHRIRSYLNIEKRTSTTASNINKDKSKVLVSLISIQQYTYVINA